MTVDIAARNFSVEINILDADRNVLGGPYDLSAAVASVRLNFSGLNLEGPNGYRSWAGEIFLENGITAENIDARDTAAMPSGASLLAQGNAVNLRIFHEGTFQRRWPTLYILRVPSPFDPLSAGDQNTTIELGDITQLEDTEQPEGNLSGMTLGTTYTRSEIANNILATRGLPTSTDTISAYSLSVPTQKLGTNSWPNEIGKLAGTAGYFFWIDQGDNARFTPIDLNKAAPDFTLTIGQDEVDRDGWKRVNLSERPPSKLIVTGTGGRAIARDNPEVITDIRPEKETTYTRDISVGTNRVTETYEERLSERLILPRIPTKEDSNGTEIITGYTENSSTSLRVALRETIVWDYSSITKELKTKQITVEVARGKAGGDAFRDTDDVSDAYDLIDTQETTINYDYDDGRLSDSETSTRRPWALIPWANVRPNNYEANRFLFQTNLTKEESWRKRVLSGQSWKYAFETQVPQGELTSYFGSATNADVLRDDPDRTGVIESSEDGAARPPATEYMPLLYEQDNRQYEGSIDMTPLAGQAHKNRLRTVAIQGPYVVSNAQCEFLAELIGRLEHGGSLGQQFTGAIPSWLINSFSPGARVDVTDGALVKAYFLNGWTITADATEVLWGCSLAELGVVGAAPADVTPPVQVTYPVTYSATGPSPVFAAAANLVLDTRHSVTAPSPEFSANVIENGNVQHSLTGPSPEILAAIVENARVEHLIVGPSPDFSANVLENGTVEHTVTAPSPEFSATVIAPDPDAQNYIARQNGTYSQAELDAINAFFVQLKNDGLYALGDAAYLFASDTAADAVLNLFGTDYTAANTNMTFTAREGFTGNGTDSYIDSNFNPFTVTGANYVLNSGSASAYLRLNLAEDGLAIGARSTAGSDTRTYIQPRPSGNASLALLNARSLPVTGTVTDSRGLFTVSRPGSNATSSYRNDTLIASRTETPVGLPRVNIYFGAYNNAGALTLISNNQFAFGWIGAGLTATQVANLSTAVTDLLTVFGANV